MILTRTRSCSHLSEAKTISEYKENVLVSRKPKTQRVKVHVDNFK